MKSADRSDNGRPAASPDPGGGSLRRQFLKTAGLAGLAAGLCPHLLVGCGDDPGGQSALKDGGAEPGADSRVEGGIELGADAGGEGARAPRVFSVVALPDTQHYAESFPELFLAQTQWVVDNREQEQIAFVTHLGDVVDNGPDLRQWENAKRALALLDEADVPYGVCLGNHDLQYSNTAYRYPDDVDNSCSPRTEFDCSASHFLTNFGPQAFAGRLWYGGASPSGTSSCQLLELHGLPLLFLHLAVDCRPAELAWAQQVLDANPASIVHLSTHRYMYDFRFDKGLPLPLSLLPGGRYQDLLYSFEGHDFVDSTKAEALFAEFIARNPRIFMIQCGHVDAELRQVSRNASGLPVHELLCDYQSFSDRGGDGWLRLLRFDLDAGSIQVRTFSPSLGRYRTNEDGFATALIALRESFDRYAGRFSSLLDVEALRQEVEYYTADPTGQQELFQLLFAAGRRDVEFELELDFTAYGGQQS